MLGWHHKYAGVTRGGACGPQDGAPHTLAPLLHLRVGASTSASSWPCVSVDRTADKRAPAAVPSPSEPSTMRKIAVASCSHALDMTTARDAVGLFVSARSAHTACWSALGSRPHRVSAAPAACVATARSGKSVGRADDYDAVGFECTARMRHAHKRGPQQNQALARTAARTKTTKSSSARPPSSPGRVGSTASPSGEGRPSPAASAARVSSESAP
jgi:hypothetical protein